MGTEQGYVGFRQEATYGAGGAPQYFLPATAGAPEETLSGLDRPVWGTAGNEPLPLPQIGIAVRASAEAQPDVLSQLLPGVLGASATTLGFGGAAYRYVFSPKIGRLPSYALEVSNGSIALRAVGVRLTGLTLQLQAGGVLQLALQGIGRSVSPVAVSVASYASELAPRWDVASVLVSGQVETAATQTTVAFTRPVQPVAAVGRTGRIAEAVGAGPLQTALAFQFHRPTSAWLSYLRLGRELSWELRAPGSAISTVTSRQLTITCPRIRLASAPFTVEARGQPLLDVRAQTYPGVGAPRGVTLTIVSPTVPPSPPQGI